MNDTSHLAPEPVLTTMHADGSRRWLTPKLSKGRWLRARRVVGWVLIVVFGALPWWKVGGYPAVLLDLRLRRFHFFGVSLGANDTALLMLFGLSVGFFVFFTTALYGRVWCGWGCPQTVYMELVFRPVDRLFGERGTLRRAPRWLRRPLRVVVYVGLAAYLAHTFLAYFVGVEALGQWMQRSPVEHPAAFIVALATTALILVDFGYFREQMCTVACPYARLQAVLLDKDSLIVAYDAQRGEPRGKLARRAQDEVRGDCIDCRACVVTCPTGIDIRKGLQLECVACTQCIDACDAIMARVNKPQGLIRYAALRELEERKPARRLRGRTAVYGLMFVACAAAFGVSLAVRRDAVVTVVRASGVPFLQLADGSVVNTVTVRIENRQPDKRRFWVSLVDADELTVRGELPLEVMAHGRAERVLVISAPRDAITGGARAVRFAIRDDAGEVATAAYRLLGPRSQGGL